ncbi:MAG: VCBS repeat-containing protein [Gammaproteobacteria bacterium]|nr:VCBS repeat-containing protein [Gammaproteobacteria bacterium]
MAVSVADYDGDGYQDVMYNKFYDSDRIFIAKGTYSGLTGEVLPLYTGGGNLFGGLAYSKNSNFKVLDFNGDGRADITLSDTQGNCTFYESVTPTLFGGNHDFEFKNIGSLEKKVCELSTPMDFNGDGNTDILVLDDGTTGFGILSIYINRGGGGNTTDLFGGKITPFPYISFSKQAFSTLATPIDYNGDGKMDLLMPEQRVLDDWPTPGWTVRVSTGHTFIETRLKNFAPLPRNDFFYVVRPIAIDVNGDGETDVLTSVNRKQPDFWNVAISKNAIPTSGVADPENGIDYFPVPSDTVHTITTGFGAKIKIKLAPLTKGPYKKYSTSLGC